MTTIDNDSTTACSNERLPRCDCVTTHDLITKVEHNLVAKVEHDLVAKVEHDLVAKVEYDHFLQLVND